MGTVRTGIQGPAEDGGIPELDAQTNRPARVVLWRVGLLGEGIICCNDCQASIPPTGEILGIDIAARTE